MKTVRNDLVSGRILSVMLTHRCTAECADCGTFSSPRVNEGISVETALDYILQASINGFRVIVFTGGEATLRWRDLKKCISYAAELNLATRLVTNGHWATSFEVASGKITELIEAGLCEINLSTGDEHARFVPLDRVVFGSIVAVRLKLRTCVTIEKRRLREIDRFLFLSVCRKFAASECEIASIRVVESTWMPVDSARFGDYLESATINGFNADRTKGCESVLRTYTLQANGRFGACCGIGMQRVPELNVGVVGELLSSIVAKGEGDFVRVLLRYIGPHRILKWAAEKDPTILWENLYAHHCQACLRIYGDERVGNVLRKFYSEWEDEVAISIEAENAYVRICHKPSDGLEGGFDIDSKN